MSNYSPEQSIQPTNVAAQQSPQRVEISQTSFKLPPIQTKIGEHSRRYSEWLDDHHDDRSRLEQLQSSRATSRQSFTDIRAYLDQEMKKHFEHFYSLLYTRLEKDIYEKTQGILSYQTQSSRDIEKLQEEHRKLEVHSLYTQLEKDIGEKIQEILSYQTRSSRDIEKLQEELGKLKALFRDAEGYSEQPILRRGEIVECDDKDNRGIPSDTLEPSTEHQRTYEGEKQQSGRTCETSTVTRGSKRKRHALVDEIRWSDRLDRKHIGKTVE